MITSLENSKIKYLQKLLASKNRKKEQCFIVEGAHLVKEAKQAGLLIEAYALEDKEGYIGITDSIMKKIVNTDTIISEIGLCKMPTSKKLSNRILILDGIQDPGNMGTLMRSACAFGFDTLLIGEGSCDIYNPKVIRSSQGAIFKLNFIFGSIKEWLPQFTGYTIYGTDVRNGLTMDLVQKTSKIGLILGNEGNGISEEIQSLNLQNIYIPMQNTESLNVAIAGSILMYEFNK